MEEKARREEEKAREEQEREERERKEAEKERQRKEDEAEKERQRKLEEKQAKKAAKDKAREEAMSREPVKKTKADKSQDGADKARVESFADRVDALIDGGSAAKVSALAEDVTDILAQEDLETVVPVGRLMDSLLRHSRHKEDDFVVKLVQRFAPVLTALIDKAGVHRFKVKVLCEAQRIAYEMGLPRLSPESALIEVFFDALYRAEIVEEEYFDWWSTNSDDTPGKTTAMFQVNPFLDWLREAKYEGEESSDEEKGSDEESDEEEDDDDDEVDNEYTKRPGYR
jgi:hypothetical protein